MSETQGLKSSNNLRQIDLNSLSLKRQLLTNTLRYQKILKVLLAFTILIILYILHQKYTLYNQIANTPCLHPRSFRIKQVDIPIGIKPADSNLGYFRDRKYETAHIPGQSHRDTPITLHYPTLGMPIQQQYYNDTKVAQEQLADFDQAVLQIIKPFTDTSCKLRRIGEGRDGGYVLCENLLHYSKALLNIGVYDTDHFGCQLTTQFPMPNYQYNCTHPNLNADCPTNGGLNFFAQNVCPAQNSQLSGSIKFYTLDDILKSRGLVSKPITVRYNSYYNGLKNVPLQFLQHFDQLMIDLRFDLENQWGHLDIIKSISKYMVPVNLHSNNGYCFDRKEKARLNRKITSGNLQVTFANKNRIQMKSEKRSFEEGRQNTVDYARVGYFMCPLHD